MDIVDTFLNGELQWQGSKGLKGELVPQNEVPVLVPAQEAAVLGQQPSQSVGVGYCTGKQRKYTILGEFCREEQGQGLG